MSNTKKKTTWGPKYDAFESYNDRYDKRKGCYYIDGFRFMDLDAAINYVRGAWDMEPVEAAHYTSNLRRIARGATVSCDTVERWE